MSHHSVDLAALLHKKGYRMTYQRQAILDAVCAVDGHATPHEIYEEVQQVSEAINQATVYRTLDFLREVGLVNSTSTLDGRTVYELAIPHAHHHLVCRQCGRDIEVPQTLVDGLLDTIKAEYHFEVDSANHLSLFGLCETCQTNQH